MALISDNLTTSLSIHGAFAKAHHWLSNWFSPPSHSPESDLLQGPLRDPRLAPQAPMNHDAIDVGTLAQLSQIGLKRGKLVSEQSHPELMQAWTLMARRAGLKTPPQLIIAESDSYNALTMNKEEVTITTGLLKILDLRQTIAVLGHELGHVSSDHTTPRITSTLLFGGAGAIVGNELTRTHGTFGSWFSRLADKWEPAKRAITRFYGEGGIHQPSLLGRVLGVFAFASLGGIIANNISVRPTELDADTKGASISGDPQALAAALTALQAHSPHSGFTSKLHQIESGYPSIEARVRHLQSLPPQSPVIEQIENQPKDVVAEAMTTISTQPGASVHAVSAERVAPTAEAALT